MKELILRKGREEAISRKHPWIFSGAIQQIDPSLEDGEHVWVLNRQGETLATGHFHHMSIAVRVLSFSKINLDLDFYTTAIQRALDKRKAINLPNEHTNAFRLIAGEGDHLSGLIIDYYNGHLVIQCHSIGMYKDIDLIKKACQEVIGDQLKSIFLKDIHIKQATYEGKFLHGNAEETTIKEHGLNFKVNWLNGQKTGFFLDQRENRALLQTYAKGRTVLNTFCYTGGFSIYALEGGAKEVHSIDISQTAMDQTDVNVELNFESNKEKHKSIVGDTMKHITNLDDDVYDMIILDPPAFAKNKKKSHNAVQAYKRLNAMAFDKIKPGGIVFTFSCSQVIDRNLFEHTIRAAAIESDRDIQIIHHMTQGPDHLVNIYHNEGHYLKGLIIMVD